MADQPTIPLGYAGGTTAPPAPAAGGGILTIGPTTYAVNSIGAVQVQTDLEPREFAGWLGIVGIICLAMAALAAIGLLLMSLSPDARGTEIRDAAIAAAVAIVFSPSIVLVRRFPRRMQHQVTLFVSGQPHVFLAVDQAAAYRLRDQISAAMAAGGGNVYVDNRQVHVHRG